MKKLALMAGAAITTTLLPTQAQAAVFNITASDSYFTFAGNISGTSDIRLLSDKATAIGFEGLDTLSFIEFDFSGLALDSEFASATLQLTYDSVLTEPANLIPATPDRRVNVSVYDLTAPFDDVNGNVDDIDYGVDGENEIATATVSADGVYTWDISALVAEWLATDTPDTGLALSGVFGNVDIDGRNSYASFYPAGAATDLAPTIVIETVPEPANLAALALAGGGVLLVRRQRQAA
ncbi:MAG: DNRLRE domain-containing protein [Cyanobacteria bacterium J06626_23]